MQKYLCLDLISRHLKVSRDHFANTHCSHRSCDFLSEVLSFSCSYFHSGLGWTGGLKRWSTDL